MGLEGSLAAVFVRREREMAREIVMEIAIREHTVRGMLCEFGDENRSSRNSLFVLFYFPFLEWNNIGY